MRDRQTRDELVIAFTPRQLVWLTVAVLVVILVRRRLARQPIVPT